MNEKERATSDSYNAAANRTAANIQEAVGKAELGPAKLTEQEIDLFKAVEAELQTLRRRLSQLEEHHRPFHSMLERWFNQELERRLGMTLGKQAGYAAQKDCEVSPMEVLRFRYNIGA